ncbi:MAG TPA: response regulator [Bacteriovoracaceae bacterium]|nr:response regulator [Bacteriovoracaceae bacterium]
MDNKTKILLVDNSIDNIQALSDLIASNDVEIHSFTTLEEAIATLAIHDFGLAILDMQMPGAKDSDLTKMIRAKQKDHLPIIFVTDQQNNDQSVLQGYKTGAIDLLFRPLNPYIVRSKVRVFVELHAQRHQLQLQLLELERLRVAAEAATIAKSQFLANMSHEIRTPLAAVMGFADLIARGEVPAPEIEECASTIRRNGTLLMHLIDDILDLSKIEANRIDMEMKPNSLLGVLEEIESTLTLKSREKSIQLYFNKTLVGNQAYIFDPIRIKQILYNIVGNAIKFSSNGEVLVNMQIGAVTSSTDRITFTVKNEGVGFTEEQSKLLFRPFGQADASIKREFGGSGLGLVISRQLARAMGGDVIILSSVPEVGTEIEISIVLERTQQPVIPHAPRAQVSVPVEVAKKDMRGKKILIVDDARDNLILLEMFLRGSGAELTLASNGLEAVEFCKKNKYDIVLMDIQMPKMDGHEATKNIRLMGQKMPIIALTAHGTKNEHEKSTLAGCDESITKPFSQVHLLERLRTHLNRTTT